MAYNFEDNIVRVLDVEEAIDLLNLSFITTKHARVRYSQRSTLKNLSIDELIMSKTLAVGEMYEVDTYVCIVGYNERIIFVQKENDEGESFNLIITYISQQRGNPSNISLMRRLEGKTYKNKLISKDVLKIEGNRKE